MNYARGRAPSVTQPVAIPTRERKRMLRTSTATLITVLAMALAAALRNG
jgi:hypothetical protein